MSRRVPQYANGRTPSHHVERAVTPSNGHGSTNGSGSAVPPSAALLSALTSAGGGSGSASAAQHRVDGGARAGAASGSGGVPMRPPPPKVSVGVANGQLLLDDQQFDLADVDALPGHMYGQVRRRIARTPKSAAGSLPVLPHADRLGSQRVAYVHVDVRVRVLCRCNA